MSSWSEPIGTLSFGIAGPARIAAAKCEAGPVGSTEACDVTKVTGETVAMAQNDVGAGGRGHGDAPLGSGGVRPGGAPGAPRHASDRIGGVPGLVVAAIALAVLALAQLVIVRRARRDDAVTPANLDATFSIRPSAALVTDLCNTMKFGSLCALGGFTPYPVMSALNHFREDFKPAPVAEAAEPEPRHGSHSRNQFRHPGLEG